MKFRSTLLFFVLLTLFSSAQDGTIDSTFGANGIITFEIRDDNYVRDMTFLEDECFITAGEYYIRNNTPYKPQLYFSKHNRNGSFDPVFGVNGLIDSLRVVPDLSLRLKSTLRWSQGYSCNGLRC